MPSKNAREPQKGFPVNSISAPSTNLKPSQPQYVHSKDASHSTPYTTASTPHSPRSHPS